MAKLTIKDNVSGKTGKAAIRATRKRFEDMPKKIAKKIPSNFYPLMANMIRGFFRQNFINQEGWKQKTFHSASYRRNKDLFNSRGDSFKIGSIGTFPIIHGTEVFGRRTDATLKAISSRAGTTTRTEFTTKDRSTDIRLTVGIDSSKFAGGTVHKNAKTGKRYKESKPNALVMFSKQVSPTGGRSIFVRLTRTQLNTLGNRMSDAFGSAFRKVYTRSA